MGKICDESDIDIESESWIWESEGGEFALDSEAEKEWCKILRSLAKSCAKSIEIEGERVYLFGKNFIDKSNIKYEYYDERKRVSYPDFIFKDKKERIHLFEVKSMNLSATQAVDSKEYKQKIKKLKEAYLHASRLCADKGGGYIFYIPVKVGEDWQIWRCENGKESKDVWNKEQFVEWMKGV